MCKCGCCITLVRCAVLIPCEIVAIALSAIFFFVWLLLVPFTVCCPCGLCTNTVEWIFETMVKMPCKCYIRIMYLDDDY